MFIATKSAYARKVTITLLVVRVVSLTGQSEINQDPSGPYRAVDFRKPLGDISTIHFKDHSRRRDIFRTAQKKSKNLKKFLGTITIKNCRSWYCLHPVVCSFCSSGCNYYHWQQRLLQNVINQKISSILKRIVRLWKYVSSGYYW